MTAAAEAVLDETSRNFYRAALGKLDEAGFPYLVGGAYAYARYTGIERHTKDFDIFIRDGDWPRAKKILEAAGYETDLTFSHWLGKAFEGENFIDLIFSAGNGVAKVDEIWFEKAVQERVLDMDVKLIPAEEMIWSKGLIMERERFDGGDVSHVIRAVGDRLDWRRLINRYAQHWRALYAHIVLFGYIYPSDRSKIPSWVVDELTSRMLEETRSGDSAEKVCYGTVISRQQYLTDINEWGYADARLKPRGAMTAEEIAKWTAGIEVDGAGHK
jgi:hypothetical protein